ncbi:MAG: tRNA wybutosine-synthesizing 3 family protein [Nanoarchaeota archaeon]|nr:tRNA wybutosine-synthesizing 3 family protein [Nanoarchaeota archaeon]
MKIDKSPQGFIDEDVKDLLKVLNDKGYETTSSCSGRVVLITNSGEKGNAKWLFKSHKKVNGNKIFDLVQKNSPVWFLQEPFILHVKAKDLTSAQKLLTIAKNSGLKISGITSIKNCTLEIRGTERMETLLTKDCSKEYVFLLVEEANKRLQKTKEKLEKFLRNVSQI